MVIRHFISFTGNLFKVSLEMFANFAATVKHRRVYLLGINLNAHKFSRFFGKSAKSFFRFFVIRQIFIPRIFLKRLQNVHIGKEIKKINSVSAKSGKSGKHQGNPFCMKNARGKCYFRENQGNIREITCTCIAYNLMSNFIIFLPAADFVFLYFWLICVISTCYLSVSLN